MFFLSLCTFPLVAADPPALTLTVSTTAVDVTNVAAHGSVVLIECARTSFKARTKVDRNAVLLHDDDGDGRVKYVASEPIPVSSVWVVVDFTSGRIAAAAMPDFPLSWSPLPADALRKDAENELAFIDRELPGLILFLVRPDVAVWEIFGRDGSVSDRDGAPNGRLKLAFEDARVIQGREKAPKHLKKDDVLIVFNPGRLDVYTAQVGK